jgi:hypothetical protein
MLTGTIAPTEFIPIVDLTPAFAGLGLILRGLLVAGGIVIAIVLLNFARRANHSARGAVARDIAGLPTSASSTSTAPREPVFAKPLRPNGAVVRDPQLRSA